VKIEKTLLFLNELICPDLPENFLSNFFVCQSIVTKRRCARLYGVGRGVGESCHYCKRWHDFVNKTSKGKGLSPALRDLSPTWRVRQVARTESPG